MKDKAERRLAALMDIEEVVGDAPPAGLIEQIVAEIPDELPPMALEGGTSKIVSLDRRRREPRLDDDTDEEPAAPSSRSGFPWTRLAASLAVILLGGFLASQLWRARSPLPVSSLDEKSEYVAVTVQPAERMPGPPGQADAARVTVQSPAAEAGDAALRRRLDTRRPEAAQPAAAPAAPAVVDSEVIISTAPGGRLRAQSVDGETSSVPAASFDETIVVTNELPILSDVRYLSQSAVVTTAARSPSFHPSTGGTHEPNDAAYGDVFFDHTGVNPFIDTEDDALSTFGLDVDTASWGVVRTYLEGGHLPPPEAVRVEEMLNYFNFGLPAPEHGEDFTLYLDGGETPFTPSGSSRYRLLRIGLEARQIPPSARRPAQLTFVVDVSGSMNRGDRLGLVKKALELLLDGLEPRDRVGLVVYGSRGEILLEPTEDLEAIRGAIDRLRPGGSTNAAEGLTLGYRMAAEHFLDGGINRVILCSDGVANVGATGPDSILRLIRDSAAKGVELTAVGFGMGNYNDVLMEQLADHADGRYAYVDSLREAERLFVDELGGTLETIAEEAKVQVEFEPRAVERYRLLGYENRDIADEDFRDDRTDAGEIGAGHSVTALYEIKLRRTFPPRRRLGTVHLRYRRAGEPSFTEVEQPLRRRHVTAEWRDMEPEARLAAVVAEFAEILRRSYWAKGSTLDALVAEVDALEPHFEADERFAEIRRLARRAAELESPVSGQEQ